MTTAPPYPLADDLSDIPALVARMQSGGRRATSRIVTELERASAAMPAILAALNPSLGRALVMDFDDLLGLTVKLLTEHAVVREKWQRKYR